MLASLSVTSRPRNSFPSCAAKLRASNTTSSSRSRSGGISIGKTASRKKRSPRNSPLSTAARKSLLVAATMRTSTGIDALPPIRSFDRVRLADDARKAVTLRPLFAQQKILRAQAQLLERTLDEQQQVIRIDGLLKKIVRTIFHRLHRFIDRSICRHHNYRHVIV